MSAEFASPSPPNPATTSSTSPPPSSSSSSSPSSTAATASNSSPSLSSSSPSSSPSTLPSAPSSSPSMNNNNNFSFPPQQQQNNSFMNQQNGMNNGNGNGNNPFGNNNNPSFSNNNNNNQSSLSPHGQQPPPCRLFMGGYCKYGNNCRYSHNVQIDPKHFNDGTGGQQHGGHMGHHNGHMGHMGHNGMSGMGMGGMGGMNNKFHFYASSAEFHPRGSSGFSGFYGSGSNGFSSYNSGKYNFDFSHLHQRHNNSTANSAELLSKCTAPNTKIHYPKEGNVEQKSQVGINFDKYDAIPVDVNGMDCPPALESFDAIGFPASLAKNIEIAHYTKPTPIQKFALPAALRGRDLIAAAQTGSGKTAAFLFPLISLLLTQERRGCHIGYGHDRKYAPLGLILAPTRELATQIYEEAVKFCYYTSITPCVVYGGADIRGQFKSLDRGCDILVATPGRLIDFLEREKIVLAGVKYLVFDEADRMLDMGFEPQIRSIVSGHDMPQSEGRQTLLFSATFPKQIQKLAQDFLTNYIFISVGAVGSNNDLIDQQFEYVDDDDKPQRLMEFLTSLQSASPDGDFGLSLIFVERKKSADILDAWLRKHGIRATSIHGDRSQTDRENALQLFKSGRCAVLVATDVAARGLDISNVQRVINFDLPNSVEDYIHRIGRTGRMGATGFAMSFGNEKNANVIRDIYHMLSQSSKNQLLPQWMADFVQSHFRPNGHPYATRKPFAKPMAPKWAAGGRPAGGLSGISMSMGRGGGGGFHSRSAFDDQDDNRNDFHNNRRQHGGMGGGGGYNNGGFDGSSSGFMSFLGPSHDIRGKFPLNNGGNGNTNGVPSHHHIGGNNNMNPNNMGGQAQNPMGMNGNANFNMPMNGGNLPMGMNGMGMGNGSFGVPRGLPNNSSASPLNLQSLLGGANLDANQLNQLMALAAAAQVKLPDNGMNGFGGQNNFDPSVLANGNGNGNGAGAPTGFTGVGAPPGISLPMGMGNNIGNGNGNVPNGNGNPQMNGGNLNMGGGW